MAPKPGKARRRRRKRRPVDTARTRAALAKGRAQHRQGRCERAFNPCESAPHNNEHLVLARQLRVATDRAHRDQSGPFCRSREVAASQYQTRSPSVPSYSAKPHPFWSKPKARKSGPSPKPRSTHRPCEPRKTPTPSCTNSKTFHASISPNTPPPPATCTSPVTCQARATAGTWPVRQKRWA